MLQRSSVREGETMEPSKQFVCGEGRFRITLEIKRLAEGLQALLTGGEKPHIGATVLALPRTSLQDAESRSCDCYVLPVPGHKDDIIAKKCASDLCEATGEAVCVTAGVHVDNATKDDLEQLVRNCEAVTIDAARFLKDRYTVKNS